VSLQSILLPNGKLVVVKAWIPLVTVIGKKMDDALIFRSKTPISTVFPELKT